ncbi:MAG: hypothetical protein ACI936_004036 [Paraglaciecola sp.]
MCPVFVCVVYKGEYFQSPVEAKLSANTFLTRCQKTYSSPFGLKVMRPSNKDVVPKGAITVKHPFEVNQLQVAPEVVLDTSQSKLLFPHFQKAILTT